MSSLVFDPEVGLKAPETSETRERTVAIWRDALRTPGMPELNAEPSTPAGQLIDGWVAEVEAEHASMLFLANMFDPRRAEGIWQDALGYIYFLVRKYAEPTIVVCQLTGRPGTVIPYGAIVEDGESLRYMCNKPVALDSEGKGETTFRCLTLGPIDVGPGSVVKIVTAVAGWDTVGNLEAGAVGRHLESRYDFEARRAQSVAMNAHGTVASMYGSLHNLSGVAGVIDVQVLENVGPLPVIKRGVTVPGHGVTICIFGGQDDDIARVIYQKKDAGCDTGGNTTVVWRPEELPNVAYEYLILRPEVVNFHVRVVLGSSEILSPELEARIKRAVADDFNGTNEITGNPRIGLATTVYASRFYCAVLNAGTKNLYEIEIGLGDLPSFGPVVEIMGYQEPVISEDNVTVGVQA
jgi:hypothetical protein